MCCKLGPCKLSHTSLDCRLETHTKTTRLHYYKHVIQGMYMKFKTGTSTDLQTVRNSNVLLQQRTTLVIGKTEFS